MIRLFTITLFFLLFSVHAWAQPPANCTNTSSIKMLIAGDSWAQYMADDNVFNKVLSMYGHDDKNTIASTYEIVISLWGSGTPDPFDYTVSGSEAREWANEANYPYLQNVRNALNADPNIKIVFLSIGGNDILAARCDGGWYQNMNVNGAGNEAALLSTIMTNTTYVVNQILAVRPDIKVIISGYDYPNFNVQGAWGGCLWACNLCDMYACEARKQLSYSPVTTPLSSCEAAVPASVISDAGINGMMQTIEQQRKNFVATNPTRIKYDNSIGLMHHYYGDGSAAPGALAAPQVVPPYAPGGNPNAPSLRENFRLVNIESWFDAPADPIHLTAEGYTYKAKALMDSYLFSDVLRGAPNATYFSEGANDGYVNVYDGNSPQSVQDTGIRVGDNGVDFWTNTTEYYGILSFNTAALPDNATVQGASIYMIRSSADDNPFFHTDRAPRLDIKSGFFGSAETLETSDWNATASANNIGCFNGKADDNKYAIRIDLQPSALPYMNKLGKTQFRMSFNYADWSPEYITFYDGSNQGALISTDNDARLSAGNNQYYTRFTVRKALDSLGQVTKEEIVEKSELVTKPEGRMIEKVKIGAYLDEDGVLIEQYMLLMPLEHEGLGKLMGTKAPFIDIWYSVVFPIELTTFKVRTEGTAAWLSWTTATEKNSDTFEVEHSTDGISWTRIGQVKASGNTNTQQGYTFAHLTPQQGVNYYRLKMLDLSNEFEYSDIRSVTLRGWLVAPTFYPNPFDGSLQLKIELAQESSIDITITDMLGRTVHTQTVYDVSGLQVITLAGAENLEPGTYFVQVRDGEQVYVERVVKR